MTQSMVKVEHITGQPSVGLSKGPLGYIVSWGLQTHYYPQGCEWSKNKANQMFDNLVQMAQHEAGVALKEAMFTVVAFERAP